MKPTISSATKASPQPPLPPKVEDDQEDGEKPQGNATRPLQKDAERDNAKKEQGELQRKGPDALPVSDYPNKKRPPAANPLDTKGRNT